MFFHFATLCFNSLFSSSTIFFGRKCFLSPRQADVPKEGPFGSNFSVCLLRVFLYSALPFSPPPDPIKKSFFRANHRPYNPSDFSSSGRKIFSVATKKLRHRHCPITPPFGNLVSLTALAQGLCSTCVAPKATAGVYVEYTLGLPAPSTVPRRCLLLPSCSPFATECSIFPTSKPNK